MATVVCGVGSICNARALLSCVSVCAETKNARYGHWGTDRFMRLHRLCRAERAVDLIARQQQQLQWESKRLSIRGQLNLNLQFINKCFYARTRAHLRAALRTVCVSSVWVTNAIPVILYLLAISDRLIVHYYISNAWHRSVCICIK